MLQDMIVLKKMTNLKFRYLKNISRVFSFKPLDFNLKYSEAEIEKYEKKSKETDYALKLLSSYAKGGGGTKSIQRHTVVHKKLLARDRLKLLLDEDSPFLEIGLLAGMSMDYGSIPAAGAVIGIGKIHGQFCIIGVNDATVKGGVFFPIGVEKQIRMQKLALLNKLPCFYLVDSGGAFLPLQSEIFPDRDHGGRVFYNEAIMSSLGIPQVALVCGSSTAGGAYCPTMAEEAIIVKNSGIIFLGGPPLVKAATGEIVSEQDLGGAIMHCSISGCTDYFAETEEEAIAMCRESVLTFNLPHRPKLRNYEEPLYPEKDLLTISGKVHLSKDDMYIILSRILDGSKFKEFKAKFGFNLITGFGYIQGILVGILVNCDALTFQDAQKGSHFIQLCEKRNIPVCFLQNSGNLETNLCDNNLADDTLKCRAKMVASHSACKVPKIAMCINGCYEDDNFTMCGWSFEPNFFFSWPSAHISICKQSVATSKSAEADILKRLQGTKDVSACDDLFDNRTSAFHHASRMQCDGIISPDATRQVLALCLEIVNFRSAVQEPSVKFSTSQVL